LTWQEARQLARERVDKIEKLALARRPLPKAIPITEYPDEETFNFLLVDAGWTFRDWQIVNRAVTRLLRDRGWKVMHVPLRMEDYFAWLAAENRENTSESRAIYAGTVAMQRSME
jgi:hypothetical protein